MIDGDLDQARKFIEYRKMYLSERRKVSDHEELN
jgi:hypothetical protein